MIDITPGYCQVTLTAETDKNIIIHDFLVRKTVPLLLLIITKLGYYCHYLFKKELNRPL